MFLVCDYVIFRYITIHYYIDYCLLFLWDKITAYLLTVNSHIFSKVSFFLTSCRRIKCNKFCNFLIECHLSEYYVCWIYSIFVYVCIAVKKRGWDHINLFLKLVFPIIPRSVDFQRHMRDQKDKIPQLYIYIVSPI